MPATRTSREPSGRLFFSALVTLAAVLFFGPTATDANTAGACPSSCSAPSFCPLSVLSAQRWAEPSGSTLIRSSWRGLTNSTDVLTLGASNGLATVALIFSSADSVTCFLARQLSTSSSTGLRLSLPLASSAIVSISRSPDGSCPATSPHFGTASSWVADILALKLNVLYTRLLAGVANVSATALETAVIGSSYGMPACECRTVGSLLRDAELYLSGEGGNDGAPPYDLCAADIVLQYGDPSCRTSPYANWLCYNVTLAARPPPPPYVEPHFPPYQPYTPEAPPPNDEHVTGAVPPPPRKSPPPAVKSPPPVPVSAKSPPPTTLKSPPPTTLKSPPPAPVQRPPPRSPPPSPAPPPPPPPPPPPSPRPPRPVRSPPPPKGTVPKSPRPPPVERPSSSPPPPKGTPVFWPPRPAGAKNPFPFGQCTARGSTVGTPYELTYTNESRAEGGDSTYCFQVGLNECDKPRCCGMRLEQIQFLIDDNCYGSVYGVRVNGKARSPSYHVYDVRGYTYTVLKLSGIAMAPQQAEGATLCFSLRSAVCADLFRLCSGPVCQLTLANQPGRQKSSCCPPQDLLLP
ncbi:hypothetical protein HXX76_002467 [Chlamydomonas incerta]|uniref:Pherophorin domain-containing protein n=1 Tax=Chlamydomonas incerta TaxID=51695 RepID=A0A835TE32_CHLIN|nr:hypothetical protein HXX76_002467 [Chlamydomonas incerta]|eukprot:KAG2442381.1 hypothetical protein HXX76_002467 [Chlamydomonas incerta]